MDTIFIRGLKVETIIGIYGWERTVKRPLRFDLELGADFAAAASSDQMRDSVNYAEIHELVTRVATELQPQLLETLAERLARDLFSNFPILSLTLTIHKPGAIPVDDVGVRISRRREDYAVCGR